MAGLKSALTESLQVEIDYKSLEAHRSVKMEDTSSVKYSVSLYLGEAVNSFNGDACMPFTMNVETVPDGISFKIMGEIFVLGPRQTVEKWISSRNDSPPKIWVQVYEEALKALASLASYLQAPPLECLRHVELDHTGGKES